ncbi:MAG: C39 family peptidase [Lachnospiraceae bacterium]|nr:C39 family peptidase [Lachnospiraceae bacterium]
MNNQKKIKKICLQIVMGFTVALIPLCMVGTGENIFAHGTHGNHRESNPTSADSSQDSSAAADTSMEPDTSVFKEYIYQIDNLETMKAIQNPSFDPASQQLPESVQLDVEEIYQLPELPTGCEITSLTMLLRYYGFKDAEKTMMADQYLVYADQYVTGFYGDPTTEKGAGIYPPGLVETTDNFLQAHGSSLYAKNLTGSTMDILYAYLAHGDPVVVWSTQYFNDNIPSGIIESYEGIDYEWDYNEHCIVLTGYNFATGTVTVHDPLEGIVERDAQRFQELYEGLGSMAMVIQ